MSTLNKIHPRQVLFGSGQQWASLPVCDHYAGQEALMYKSLALQTKLAQHYGRSILDVTLDLEDGAQIGNESAQALLIAELIQGAHNQTGRVGVRVHAPHHPRFKESLETIWRIAGQRVAYIMVPKVRDLAEAERTLEHFKTLQTHYPQGRHVPLHFLIETLGALRDVQAIAHLPGVESLSFGLMDFVSEYRGAIPASAMSAEGQFKHPLVKRAKLEIANACHTARITPSHSVVTEFKNKPALQIAAEKAIHELGYLRMWSIHPEQIEVILEAFAPVTAEVDDAVAILLEAQDAHWAPISYHGTLHDRASYRHYWHVLERAWVTGQPLPPDVVQTFFADLPITAQR